MNETSWQDRLFAKSLMKKEKVARLLRRLDFHDKAVFDLGCSQGTVSRQLRRRGGGRWAHADLDFCNLRSARVVLGASVLQVGPASLPFADETFDVVLLLDFLEHVDDDAGVLREARRILRPGGRVVISTPISGGFFLLNRLKHRFGLTPEIYGHKREGYSLAELRRLLQVEGFGVESAGTYAKFLVELFEVMLNILYSRKNRGREKEHRSGAISPASADDLQRSGKLFAFYGRFVYPLVYLVTRLDALLFWKTGYATLVLGRKP